MPRLKKMNILLILLLYSMAASASSNHPYSTDNKEYLYLPKDKPTLSWEKEPQTDKIYIALLRVIRGVVICGTRKN